MNPMQASFLPGHMGQMGQQGQYIMPQQWIAVQQAMVMQQGLPQGHPVGMHQRPYAPAHLSQGMTYAQQQQAMYHGGQGWGADQGKGGGGQGQVKKGKKGKKDKKGGKGEAAKGQPPQGGKGQSGKGGSPTKQGGKVNRGKGAASPDSPEGLDAGGSGADMYQSIHDAVGKVYSLSKDQLGCRSQPKNSILTLALIPGT